MPVLRSQLEPVAETVNDLEMRYRPAAPSASIAQHEVLGLLEDVDWFLKNHAQLWS